ncbi:hypothetical protein NB701_003949 [Pantoea ananatis]|nr:hypothetical protein [Pantoea ananatis]
MNAVSVHAAQCAGIDRHAGRKPFAVNGRYRSILADAVCSQRNGEIFGVNPGIDFRCACHNRYCIGFTAVQSLTLDGNGAFTDLQRGQVAVGIKLRFTGGQRHVRRIDKATAVTGNAVGVSHHNVGGFTRHFGIALQL